MFSSSGFLVFMWSPQRDCESCAFFFSAFFVSFLSFLLFLFNVSIQRSVFSIGLGNWEPQAFPPTTLFSLPTLLGVSFFFFLKKRIRVFLPFFRKKRKNKKKNERDG
eukprot:TRINITY_DN6487_c0_g2_i1.p1 TRINITY_DN6487_c0_g2~~TRINITY_DN6487_c0_g2_i1.p1  ORF type:complete len:107 (+),score=1.82 TRINITY_DN6487_c0_g2_i1:660-980(+)